MLGIKEEASLNDTQFGWLGSIFFIGYLIFQVVVVDKPGIEYEPSMTKLLKGGIRCQQHILFKSFQLEDTLV